MPRREDLHSILVIGSGPIVIGQACEFDYSGTQACKVLRQRGVPGRPGELQPRDDHDRPGVRRRHLRRAAHAGFGAAGHGTREARRAAAHPRGADALNVGVALAEAGELERLGVRLIGAGARGDPTRRGSPRCSRRRCARPGSACPSRGRPHAGGGARRRRRARLPVDRPAVVRRWAAAGPASRTSRGARADRGATPREPARSPRSSSRSRWPAGRSSSSR